MGEKTKLTPEREEWVRKSVVSGDPYEKEKLWWKDHSPLAGVMSYLTFMGLLSLLVICLVLNRVSKAIFGGGERQTGDAKAQ